MGKTTNIDYEALYRWIDEFPISRHKRNISRDFSDAIPLVEMLKQIYPRLVELHNYTPRNSVALKVINWETLNKKVLSKIGVNLSKKMIDQLANSKPGLIEKVLNDIKQKVEERENHKKDGGNSIVVEGLTSDMSGTIMPVKEKNSDKTIDHKLIPVDYIDKMEANLQEKDEAVVILRNKVQHLETLLHVKDERINDLTRQIEQLSGRSNTSLNEPRLVKKLF
ncbi:sperm flagellar protein 1-like [Agrilus planipennis]|uniref:Sperm flagellar protein 1-like n=1 Tax=Agrilus planipennis TaxID=224129 RepID=A0A1W4W4T6_AGRPL|nr:sperm flagellar protein 1-like [Agrilus planipennis]